MRYDSLDDTFLGSQVDCVYSGRCNSNNSCVTCELIRSMHDIKVSFHGVQNERG